MKVTLTFFIVYLLGNFGAFGQQRDLAYFLNRSLSSNPQIYDLSNQILSNRVDSQLIQAGNRFQVSGIGNGLYAPVINGAGYDAIITNGQQLSALVGVTKQINIQKNLSVAYEGLKLQRDSLGITSTLTAKELRKSVTTQYIIAFGDQQQIAISNEIIRLLSDEDSVLKRLTQNNVYKQADYLAFLVTLQQQELTRSQIRLQYKTDYSTLNLLSGIVDTAMHPLADPGISLQGHVAKDSSAFFLRFTNDSLRILNERSGIKVGYRPKISLFADAGYQSALTLTPYKNFGSSVGINVSIPIYDGHQKRLQYTKLDIAERTRKRQEEYFSSQYQQQIEMLNQQLRELDQLSQPIENQIRYLETLIKVNGKLLETGDIKITDYVLAINNYVASRNLVLQNQIVRLQLVNQLNYWNTNL